MGDAGGRAALYASTDLETMEREMQKIYDELKGHDGASAAEDLNSANSSLLKSRTATQMMAQIMGDLGPVLKDPMLQNHPLLAKYLAGDLPFQSQEDQTAGVGKEPLVPTPSSSTATPAVDSVGSTPKVSKNESEGTGKSESESDSESGKSDGAKTTQEPKDPDIPVHEGKNEEEKEGKEVEVDKLIHLFISGKKEKERVISVEKPLRLSAEHALSSALHEEQPSTNTESGQGDGKPSGEHAVRSMPSDAAPASAALVTEEKDPTMMPAEEATTKEPVASPVKPTTVCSPNTSRAARETTARKRNPAMEKEMERIRRAVEEKKAQRQRNILSRNSDTDGMRSSSEIVLPTTKTTSPAPLRSATADSSSVSPALASSAGEPKDQTQDMPARPVQLGVLPKSISIKALNAMVVQAPVQVPVPVPVPVPLEEYIAPTTTKSTSRATNTGAATQTEADDQQSREGDGVELSHRSPSVTFGPGKSAIRAKLRERSEDKDEVEKDQTKSDAGRAKAEEEENVTTPRVLVGRPKADTLHMGWTRALPPKEKVNADHRKTLLDRRTLNLGPGSSKTINSPLKLSKESTREDLVSPSVNSKAIEESGARHEEEEEEEIEESDDGKDEEDEASEYEDEGSDEEDAKKQKKDEVKTSEEKSKNEGKDSKDVEQDEGRSEVPIKPLPHQEEKEPENKSSKRDIAKSSEQPLKKSNSGVSGEIPSGSSKSAEAKQTENGIRFSRFGSASLVSAKRTYKLSEGNNTLGRGDVQIVLRAASVSRKHATITLKNGTAFIRDLGSTHGTRINDKPITAKTQLAVGDVIRLGSVRLVFTVESPLIEGVISKRSPAFHKSWQKRYCVLKRRQRDIVKLYYYRSKESRLPQGSVSMDQVVSVTDDEMGGSPTVFKIKTIMRVFEFQAKDEEDRNMWINALRAVTGNKSGNSGSNEVERSSPRHNPPPLSEEDKRKQTILELPASSDGEDEEDSDSQGPSKDEIKRVNKMF